MKFRHSLVIGCLTALLGFGAFLGTCLNRKSDIEKVEADGTTVTVYCSVSNTYNSGNFDGVKFWARLGDYVDTGDITMTLVDNGTASGHTNRKVFMGTFTEVYGGAKQFWFNVYNGSTKVGSKQALADNTWRDRSDLDGKVFNFENVTDSAWTSYTIPTNYSLVGSGSGWETDIDLTPGAGGTYSTAKEFVINEQFKIRQNHCWYRSFGYTSASGTGSACFVESDSDSNFKCTLGGNYTVKFNPSNSSFVITDNTSETFSYILTMKDDYSCGYLYNSDSDKYSEWIPAPAFSSLGGGQAYNVKISYSSKEYYGLYKISDRYLSSFSYLIAKKSGDYSGTYDNQSCTFTVTDPHSVYICNNSATPVYVTGTSAIYNALDFIYDLVGHRSSATYDNQSFAYSICATSVSEAARLINAYDNVIGTDAQNICKVSYCYVYKLTGGYSETNKEYRTIKDMVDALRIIVAKNQNGGVLNSAFLERSEDPSTTMIAVMASSFSVVAAAGFILLKKKKTL